MTDASDIFLKIHNRLQSIINCDYRLDEEGCVQPSQGDFLILILMRTY